MTLDAFLDLSFLFKIVFAIKQRAIVAYYGINL